LLIADGLDLLIEGKRWLLRSRTVGYSSGWTKDTLWPRGSCLFALPAERGYDSQRWNPKVYNFVLVVTEMWFNSNIPLILCDAICYTNVHLFTVSETLNTQNLSGFFVGFCSDCLFLAMDLLMTDEYW